MSAAEQTPQLHARNVGDVTPCGSPRSVASSKTTKSPSSGSANSWSTVSAPGGDMRLAPIDTSAPQDGGVPSVANSTLPSALDTASSTAMDSTFDDQSTITFSPTERPHSQALVPYEDFEPRFHGSHRRPDFLAPHHSKGEASTRGCSPDSFVESPQPHPMTIPPQNSPITLTRIRSCSSHSRSSASHRPRCIILGSESEAPSPRRGRSRSPRPLNHVAGYPPGYAYLGGGPPSADPSPIMHPMDTYPQLPPSPIWSPTSPPSAPRVIVPLSGDLSMYDRPPLSPAQVALPTPSMSEDHSWSPSTLLRRQATKSSREGSTASRSTLSALSEVQDFHRLSPRGPRSPFMAAKVPLPASLQPSPRHPQQPLSMLGSDIAVRVPLPESQQTSPHRERDTLPSPAHVELPPSLPESQQPTPSRVALPASALASPGSVSRYSSAHSSSLGYSPYSHVDSHRGSSSSRDSHSDRGSWSDIGDGVQRDFEFDAQSQSRYSHDSVTPSRGPVEFPAVSTPNSVSSSMPPLPAPVLANMQATPARAHRSSGVHPQDVPSRNLPVPPIPPLPSTHSLSVATSPSHYSQEPSPMTAQSTRSPSPSARSRSTAHRTRSPSPARSNHLPLGRPRERDDDDFLAPFGFAGRSKGSTPASVAHSGSSYLEAWRKATQPCDAPGPGVVIPMSPSSHSSVRSLSNTMTHHAFSPEHVQQSPRSSVAVEYPGVHDIDERRAESHRSSPRDQPHDAPRSRSPPSRRSSTHPSSHGVPSTIISSPHRCLDYSPARARSPSPGRHSTRLPSGHRSSEYPPSPVLVPQDRSVRSSASTRRSDRHSTRDDQHSTRSDRCNIQDDRRSAKAGSVRSQNGDHSAQGDRRSTKGDSARSLGGKSSRHSTTSRAEPPRVDIPSARAVAEAAVRANAAAHAEAIARTHLPTHAQTIAHADIAAAMTAEPVTAISLPSPRLGAVPEMQRGQLAPDVRYTPPMSPCYLGSPAAKAPASPLRITVPIMHRAPSNHAGEQKSTIAPGSAPSRPVIMSGVSISSSSSNRSSRCSTRDPVYAPTSCNMGTVSSVSTPSAHPVSVFAPEPCPTSPQRPPLIFVQSRESSRATSPQQTTVYVPRHCVVPHSVTNTESSRPRSCSRSAYRGRQAHGPAEDDVGRDSPPSHAHSRRARSPSVHDRWNPHNPYIPRRPVVVTRSSCSRSRSRSPIYHRRRISPSPSRSTRSGLDAPRAHSPRSVDVHHSPDFYFTDGTLYVKVETVMYRIYKHFFQKSSPVWKDMLRGHRVGRTESEPLILNDVKADDFDQLLSLVYPDFVSSGPTTAKQWTGVLELVMQWKIDVLRKLVIDKLAPLASSVDKLVLGEKYGIEGWAKEAYKDLCLRRAPLSKEEGRRLGVDAVVRINEMKYALMENLGALVDGEKLAGVVEGVLKE
ncbi:uncharacterized protein SCHCODRAFT_01099699 [Schizophyllum commune H4-8]|nr:uncharacterized protein SCHCODRAFT_01099699 [Schizophyllum commune H4-8]KAI5890073.1 hypothetical protein SCHCODRAFT_01099699 [Schizophyllum commune H4-8]